MREMYMLITIEQRGIILHGSPGNGKTITIKALINHLQRQPDPVPTLYVKSMKDKCKGDQESLKRLFKDARRRAPILLVFEDLDSLISGEVRSHFLNEIDGKYSKRIED
jgi:transitional endoplasmic reticulum ATPase